MDKNKKSDKKEGIFIRYIIYGAGAVGGMLAAYLTHAGHKTLLIVRPRQVAVIKKNGVHLISPSSDFIAHVKAVTGPDQIIFRSDDLVFLAVKSQDTEEALTDLKKYVNDIPIFCFQNGIRNEEMTFRLFSKVYGVMVRVIAVSMNDGEVIDRAETPGYFIIGSYPNGIDIIAEQVAEVLRKSGFLCFLTPDIMAYKWEKLLMNLFNAPNAITNTAGEEAFLITGAAVREAENVLKKAGIHWVSKTKMDKEWPETAYWPGKIIPNEAWSSTWQSLARGGSVEIEYLNGEIVRLAERLGLRAPINEKLLNIVKEMSANHEKPGKYTPSELARILGLKIL